ARAGAEGSPFTARRRDRRQALGDLLLMLTRALDRRDDISLMRGAFEEGVRRLVPVRTAQLRDPSSRWSTRYEVSPGAEPIAPASPGSEPAGPGILEATFEPGSPLGEWDFQMLGLSAQLGALVLEIERTRLHLVRAGLMNPVRPRRESAAPMVGST